MTTLVPVAVSPLRQRLIDEMEIQRFGRETQRNYIRDVGRFATFLGRSPDTATAEDVRRFQIEQGELDVPAPTMNAIVSALRFFFTQTLDRPDLGCKLVRMRHEHKLPVVLSRDEVARLLDATTCLKHQAALSVAYGAGLRAAEVAALKVRDIDSERMLLQVERGKPVLSLSKGAGGIATPCYRPDCWRCCESGGGSAGGSACCTSTADCSPASTTSSRSAPGSCTASSWRQVWRRVSASASGRTRCGTASRPTSSRTGSTSASSRRCWGMPSWKPPLITPRSPRGCCAT